MTSNGNFIPRHCGEETNSEGQKITGQDDYCIRSTFTKVLREKEAALLLGWYLPRYQRSAYCNIQTPENNLSDDNDRKHSIKEVGVRFQ